MGSCSISDRVGTDNYTSYRPCSSVSGIGLAIATPGVSILDSVTTFTLLLSCLVADAICAPCHCGRHERERYDEQNVPDIHVTPSAVEARTSPLVVRPRSSSGSRPCRHSNGRCSRLCSPWRRGSGWLRGGFETPGGCGLRPVPGRPG